MIFSLMATNATGSKKRKSKVWIYPPKSGIHIREILNRTANRSYGISYRVEVPAKLAGKRLLKQFTKKKEAYTWAEFQFAQAQRQGQAAFDITPWQREQAIEAFVMIDGLDMTLPSVVKFAVAHLKPEKGDIRISELVEKSLQDKVERNLRPRSIEDFRSRGNKISESFGHLLVKDVNKSQIEDWLKSFPNLSPCSILNYRRAVYDLFEFAIREGYRMGENPVARIRTPKIDWVEPKILRIEEAQNLITTAYQYAQLELLPFIAIGLFAGIRVAEMTRLRWDNIQLDEKTIYISSKISKKRRVRMVTIEDNLLEWLFLCPDRDGPICPLKYKQNFTKLHRLAGFHKWHTNLMRHSFGSYYFEMSGDPLKTATVMGHRSSDQQLFDSYRAFVRRGEGKQYFDIRPGRLEKPQVVPFTQADKGN